MSIKSNFPLSTITPPIVVPWPPMNLVAEWTTISAPYSIGLIRYGVPNVLSTTNGILCLCAIFAILSISTTSEFGFPKDSIYTAFVFSCIAASISSKLCGFTKVDVIP